MNKHLSIRVAWHDNKWNGSVCNQPGKNAFCLNLPRIYAEKNEAEESKISGESWSNLSPDSLPPCKAEGGAFMAERAYKRRFKHPYSGKKKNKIPHQVLEPTIIDVPPYSTFAVPFWWMLLKNQRDLQKSYPEIPNGERPPFHSAWVYDRNTQNVLLDTFFKPIKAKKSIAIFYVKGANPLDEDSRRLIAGIGSINKVSPVLTYQSTADYTYPLWDRLITHGIRPGQADSEGILLPYHDYIALPEDFILKTEEGKKTKADLIDEIKLTLSETASRKELMDEFSYGSAWVNNSTVLTILGKLRTVVERIKSHGIAKGQWDNNLLWIDSQLGLVKESMGPFPSFAQALLAFKFEHGHSLEADLREKKIIGPKDNPWDAWEDLLFGQLNLGRTTYSNNLPHIRDVWINESSERKNLLQLLSRFELTEKQIETWFDNTLRKRNGYDVSNKELLENPYRIAEEDDGDKNQYPIAVETIDNALFLDKAIQGEFEPKIPQLVESPLDPRRMRAILVQILKEAALNGDTLMSFEELTEAINNLKLERSTAIPEQYLKSNIDFINNKLSLIETSEISGLQLEHYYNAERFFRKVLLARAKKELPSLNESWEKLIIKTISDSGIKFNPENERHKAALEDQVKALIKITNRKISVLHGPAGTGKTTVMGALFGCKDFSKDGVLLLAPTGKARVKLGKMANSKAYTIAQFLNQQKRFDWNRMKPRFPGEDKYQGKRNVIIDECSMLTEDDLYALFQSLDLAHVKRIILVGDPFQLPPIGAGKPFADFCSYLETLEESDSNYKATQCLARLNEVVRTVAGANSDSLTLASWFSGIKPSKNADEIFDRIGDNDTLNDLQVHCWNDETELKNTLNVVLEKELDLEHAEDYVGLNKFLGIDNSNIDTTKIEQFQLLTPVKGPFWGSHNLNRQFQQQFRKGYKSVKIGDYQLGNYDKIIQNQNEWREAYPSGEKIQLSNGQLGIIKHTAKGFANVVFAGENPDSTFGYKSQGSSESDDSSIELAYAITIHKSQGSDFDKVFLVIPKTGRIISRELIYTALTRSKKQLVLFMEGDSPHWIFNLSKPQFSSTAKRNTNIFVTSLRDVKSSIPWAEGLIHKTKKEGLIVRSKSEVIIANMLLEKGIEFQYEREFQSDAGQKRIPDFSFIDAAGELIILEHLGMLSIPSYKADWEKKKKFYEDNGFVMNENFFITTESEKDGIDSMAIERVINKIYDLI
ncbi:AAA family ATPase [Nonlabens xiamenensis]|uniref:AAA family ATPase n=1 Tax=Nonlabens xiamenensis TaxID=2341043 RepID=UPI000F60E0E9|nr:AAA family ATPase [Nonlabens xiamenensis]